MTKTHFATAALALAVSILATGSDPAEARRRGRVMAVSAGVVVDAGSTFNGCGVRATGCGAPRDCRPTGYYDMSYLYVIPSMTPNFGNRTPQGRCWF